MRYEAVNAMLLNEFLKEHRTVQEQRATIAQLKQEFAKQRTQIEALAAGLQKVSAQLEANKSAPQVVNNKQSVIIADNLSKAGWSWGCVSAIDSNGRTIFVADAHRDNGKRFVVRADEKLTALILPFAYLGALP